MTDTPDRSGTGRCYCAAHKHNGHPTDDALDSRDARLRAVCDAAERLIAFGVSNRANDKYAEKVRLYDLLDDAVDEARAALGGSDDH